MPIINDILSKVKIIGLDSAPIIYWMELNKEFLPFCVPFFEAIGKRKIMAVTSFVTITEALVHPIRDKNSELHRAYYDLFHFNDYFSAIQINYNIAEQAGKLRAKYRLKTPDALQIATAIAANCQAFLTNDKALKRVEELPIIVLQDLVL